MKKQTLENESLLSWHKSNLIKWMQPEKKRYYYACLEPDLLGDLIITQSWGGLGSRRGGRKSHYCENAEQAQQYLAKLSKRRKQHGYYLEDT